jgi:hypothetical protein
MNRRQFSISLAALCAAAPITAVLGSSKDKGVSNSFAPFLEALPPDGKPQPLTTRLDAALEKHAHPRLIAFWREVGFGSFGDGFLHFFHPETYADMLGQWLMADAARPDRIPFARTAFGDLFYFRDLREKALAGGAKAPSLDDASDISFLSVHYSSGGLVSYSAEKFFDGELADFVKKSELVQWPLYRQLRAKQPAPDADSCYYFEPALRLGGSADVKHIGHGNCLVHLDILFQLAAG